MDQLIVAQDLKALGDSRLKTLLHKVSQALACARPGSREHRNAIGSLENIRRELAQRVSRRPPAPSP